MNKKPKISTRNGMHRRVVSDIYFFGPLTINGANKMKGGVSMSYLRLRHHGYAIVSLLVLSAIGSVLPLHAQSASTPAEKGFTMPAQAQESAAETKNKEIALAWFKLTFIEGKAAAAFEKYVSRDFVEHSRRLRGGYDSTLKVLSMMKPRMLTPIAVVNDDIVLLQSEIGNEVFRIQNGKISDHWDLNP